MPWQPRDSARFTKKATSPKKQRQWADVSDSVLSRTGDEGLAIREANGVIKKGSMKAAKRNSLPASKFGLPGQRKYPVDTRGRAANAKARATQQVKRGNLSTSQKATIDRKANRVLGESGGSAMDAAASALMRKRRMR